MSLLWPSPRHLNPRITQARDAKTQRQSRRAEPVHEGAEGLFARDSQGTLRILTEKKSPKIQIMRRML
uniref:Uncharacterized protein n=1 Tax=Arundo donax TaxID=35708 RepID=A0A0A9CX41_ARUDO